MKNIIEEFPFVTIWKLIGFPSGINEKALIGVNGYIGQTTGTIYPFTEYYHSEQFIASVKSTDDINQTGMDHLNMEWSDSSEENNKSLKESLIGKQLIVEEAHWVGDRKIYRSVYPEFEYWSDLELEIGEKIR